MKNYNHLFLVTAVVLGITVLLIPCGANVAGPSSGLFTFISPSGGEKIVVGKTYNIEWTGPIKWIVSPKVIESISNVKLILSCGDPSLGATNDTVIVKSTANDGLYKWSVSKKLSTSDYCRIIIEDTKGRYYDVSPVFGIGMTPSPTLNVSCSASPSSVNINQTVTFISSASGGTGSYSYSWSGACTGSSANCSNSFPSSGIYSASLIVISGSQSKSASCSVSVTASTPSGTLTISKDSSSPIADIIIAGETSTLGVFRLAANNAENLDVDNITVSVVGGANVDTYYLYNGTTLLSTVASGTAPKFVLSDGTLTVPANGYVRLTLKGKMIVKENVINNTTIIASFDVDDAVNTTGLSSGAEVDSNSQTATANAMDLYQTKPTFAVVASRSGYSLSGNLIPSSSMLAAIFDITANASEDVTFEASIGGLIVGISRVQNDTDGLANTWTLKDQDGTTLDTASVTDVGTIATFDFTNSGFTVPAGQTKSLLIYADTTEFEDDGDVIQLRLDDDNGGNNVTWSINNDGGIYHDGDKIFRNDIYAGAFVNPS